MDFHITDLKMFDIYVTNLFIFYCYHVYRYVCSTDYNKSLLNFVNVSAALC